MPDPAEPGPAAAQPRAQTQPEPLPSPLDAAGDLRTTAKWTLAAAGAVGAALISGGPLVAIGSVHGLTNALLAGLGLALALTGVALSIWSTSRVLAPRLTTARTLTSPRLASLREDLDISQNDVREILGRPDREREIAASLTRQATAPGNWRRRPELEYQLRRVTDNAARAETTARRLLALGHVWQIQNDLRLSRRWTLAGGVLVAAGAVLFFIATGSSGPTYVPVLTPQVTSTPITHPLPFARSGF